MTDAVRGRPPHAHAHNSSALMTAGNIMTALKEREALAFPRLFIGKRSGNNNNYGRRFFRPQKEGGELLFLPSLPKLLLINEPFLFLLGNNGHLTTTVPHSFTLVGGANR